MKKDSIHMKKTIVVAMLAAVLLGAPAAQAITTPAENPFASKAEEVSGLIDACMAAFNELIGTYEGIVDTASANAAAEKLPALHTSLQAAVDKVNALGETDEETQALFMTRLMPMLFVFGGRTTTAFDRIKENAYYGSESLRNFMEYVLPQE